MPRSERASSKTRHEKTAKKQKGSELGPAGQIWSSMLDGRYAIAVRRLKFSSGELTIREGKNLIHRQKVNLMYGAIFGADVRDVATWQEIATKVVDDLKSVLEMPQQDSIERVVSHKLTSPKCNTEADDEVRKAMARARKLLDDRGIDCAAPIHREAAARFMVEFANLERSFRSR